MNNSTQIPASLPPTSSIPPLSPSHSPSSPTTSSSQWQHYCNKVIGQEISRISPYFSEVIQIEKLSFDHGILLNEVEALKKESSSSFPLPTEHARLFLLNGNLNHHHDIEGLFRKLLPSFSRHDRILAVLYNPYLAPLLHLLKKMGIRKAEVPETFLTKTDLHTVAALANLEVVWLRPVLHSPIHAFGLGSLINKILPGIPLLRWCGGGGLALLRPKITTAAPPTVSVIIPARNEKGNIRSAIARMPTFDGALKEVLFVEGHSSDGTWEEIENVRKEFSGSYSVSSYQQTGKGKSDAVRLGFSRATGDLLMILDADLTMPPELLPRFYDAYTRGLGDFINGSRLLYPMEGHAMKPLNRLGNIFFAKALSLVLGCRLSDSLCGTKVVSRLDYKRMTAWREDFGEFDPFGDFDLLFPAAVLGLGIVDVPIRYRDRVYGTTNIQRFRHGLMLLKMTLIGYLKITLGKFSVTGHHVLRR